MPTTVEHADRDFLALLARRESSTVQGLCADLGVTATAVRQRLARLMAANLVERRAMPAERGRPYHVYHISDLGRRQLGDGYGELARLLWREVTRIEETAVRARLLSRLKQALVNRYRPAQDAGSLHGRFAQLQQALDAEGIQVDVTERHRGSELLPILREHSCPYYDLAAEDPTICDLEQSVFGEVLGVPVALTQCCRNGHSCCEFEPVLQ